MKTQKGFALIAVLLILEMTTMLIFASYQHNIIQLKLTQNTRKTHSLKNAADHLLAIVENAMPCNITKEPPYELVKKPLSWWRLKSCAGNFNVFQYYYVTEELGNDECALIEQDTISGVKMAKYLRVTLLVVKEDEKILLQSTIILPKESAGNCFGNKRSVKLGRQSWVQII